MRMTSTAAVNMKRVVAAAFWAVLLAGLPRPGYSATVVYTYDKLHRVTHVDYDNSKAAIDYGYDSVGNRTTHSTTIAGSSSPTLTINSPANGAIATANSITLFGLVSDPNTADSGTALVKVDGIAAQGGRASGALDAGWSLTVPLQQGSNTFTVIAEDAGYGANQDLQQITIETDFDKDGMPDSWEVQNFGNTTTADDTTDTDKDGLTDLQEYLNQTDPNNADTDGDGFSDYEEVTYGSNPLLITDTPDSHRPYAPSIQPPTGTTPVHGAQFTASAFADPDLANTPPDHLAAAQWQISTDNAFPDDQAVLDRTIERKATDDANVGLTLVIVNGVLNKNTVYWIRTRHRDSAGLWSAWSAAVPFNTAPVDPSDSDDNGIDDHYQVSGFTDVNGNGVDDTQEGIMPVSNAEDGTTIGVSVDNGTITDLTALPSSTIPLPISPDLPLQFGLYSFRVQGLPVDTANPARVQISFILPQSSATLAKWYKYDRVTNQVTDISSALTVDNRTAMVTITDGSPEDGDGVVNGVIIDPSGPGYKTVVDSVTTSSSPIVPGSQVVNTDNTTTGGGSGLWLVMAGLIAVLGRLGIRRGITGRGTTRSGGSAGTAA